MSCTVVRVSTRRRWALHLWRQGIAPPWFALLRARPSRWWHNVAPWDESGAAAVSTPTRCMLAFGNPVPISESRLPAVLSAARTRLVTERQCGLLLRGDGVWGVEAAMLTAAALREAMRERGRDCCCCVREVAFNESAPMMEGAGDMEGEGEEGEREVGFGALAARGRKGRGRGEGEMMTVGKAVRMLSDGLEVAYGKGIGREGEGQEVHMRAAYAKFAVGLMLPGLEEGGVGGRGGYNFVPTVALTVLECEPGNPGRLVLPGGGRLEGPGAAGAEGRKAGGGGGGKAGAVGAAGRGGKGGKPKRK